MARIVVTRMVDIVSELPVLEEMNATHKLSGDVFLCANGFEPRALAIPEAAAATRSRFAVSHYFEYDTNLQENAASRPRLLQALGSIGVIGDPLKADAPQMGLAVRQLFDSLAAKSRSQVPHVVFDVSAATNRLIMTVVKAALESDVSLDVVYSEAEIYHPTEEEHEKNKAEWTSDRFGGLEWGVGEVAVASDEFPGYHVDQLPDFVVIIAGFNRDRARAVISHADPSLLHRSVDPTLTQAELASARRTEVHDSQEQCVAWLLGDPHLGDDRWRLDAQREIHGIEAGDLQLNLSTFEYGETLRLLEQLYLPRRGQRRFSLGPMGSKMQAVGAALFCHVRPDVRVLFAKPKEYNAVLYSEGCKAMWRLSFGPCQALKKRLDRLDLIELID